jgi:hypothetical protein
MSADKEIGMFMMTAGRLRFARKWLHRRINCGLRNEYLCHTCARGGFWKGLRRGKMDQLVTYKKNAENAGRGTRSVRELRSARVITCKWSDQNVELFLAFLLHYLWRSRVTPVGTIWISRLKEQDHNRKSKSAVQTAVRSNAMIDSNTTRMLW